MLRKQLKKKKSKDRKNYIQNQKVQEEQKICYQNEVTQAVVKILLFKETLK